MSYLRAIRRTRADVQARLLIFTDTTTLSNRGLITSTISLPWLVTTWIGPPIGAWFQRRGEPGYRIAYAAFGILLPVVAGVLFFVGGLKRLRYS